MFALVYGIRWLKSSWLRGYAPNLRYPAGTITVYASSFVLVAVACFGACTWSLTFAIAAAPKVEFHYFYNLPLGLKLDPRLSLISEIQLLFFDTSLPVFKNGNRIQDWPSVSYFSYRFPY